MFLPKSVTNLIKSNTTPLTKPLVPELSLHLISKSSPWYYQTHVPQLAHDPFWTVFWPGGQSLARFVFDNGTVVRNKTVLDIGCGCGATSIACQMKHSHKVISNDIDLMALAATAINAELNHLYHPMLSNLDLIDGNQSLQSLPIEQVDVVFLGDMFYDEEFAKKVFEWCKRMIRNGSEIYIGDPGRWGLDLIRPFISNVAQYDIDDVDNREFSTVNVFKFKL